jgi:hypothetical protein
MRKNSLDKISVNDINEEGHNNNLSSAKENVKAGKKKTQHKKFQPKKWKKR